MLVEFLIYALKSYSGSVAVRRSSTGARGRMSSSSSGPPWSYKDGPFLPVSFLGFLLVSFFFCPPPPSGKDFVTPGVRFGSTFAMVTTDNPMQITALSSVGAMGICNCSNDACVGPTNVSTFLDSCYLSRYLFLFGEEEAADGCYNVAYTYPTGTVSLSVSDRISTTQGICCRQVHLLHSFGFQSGCIPNYLVGVGLPTAGMLPCINRASQWKLRNGTSHFNALLSMQHIREGNALLVSALLKQHFKPYLWQTSALNLFGFDSHIWEHYSLSCTGCLEIRTLPREVGILIPKQKETVRVVIAQGSLPDWCSAAIFARHLLCHVTSTAPNRRIQDCSVREGEHLHFTSNLTYDGTVDEAHDFLSLRSDDGGDDAVGLVHDAIDAAVFAIASLLLYSTLVCRPCKADVFVGSCFFAQLRWILKDGKIWHVLATCCQKIDFCRGSVQVRARMQDCSHVLLLGMLGCFVLLHVLRVCCNHLISRSRFLPQAISSCPCCFVPVLATAMMLLILMACTLGTAAGSITVPPPEVLLYGTSVQRTSHALAFTAAPSVLRPTPNEHMPVGNTALRITVSTSNTASYLGNVSQGFWTLAPGYCPATATSIFFLMLCAMLVVGPQTCYLGGKECICLYAAATAMVIFEGCLAPLFESGAISTHAVVAGLGLCLSVIFP